MAETDYNCVEECKTLAKAISEQAQTNAGYKVAAELTGLELAREEAAASDRIAALYTPTILKIKIHTDPLVIEACDRQRIAAAAVTVGEAALAGLTAEYQCAKLLVQYKIATLGAVAAVSASEPDPAAAVVATPAAAPGKLASLKSLFGFAPAA